jgi:hypothetical protein
MERRPGPDRSGMVVLRHHHMVPFLYVASFFMDLVYLIC